MSTSVPEELAREILHTLDATSHFDWYGHLEREDVRVCAQALLSALSELEGERRENERLRRTLKAIYDGQRNASKSASYGGTRWVNLSKREMMDMARRALHPARQPHEGEAGESGRAES